MFGLSRVFLEHISPTSSYHLFPLMSTSIFSRTKIIYNLPELMCWNETVGSGCRNLFSRILIHNLLTGHIPSNNALEWAYMGF